MVSSVFQIDIDHVKIPGDADGTGTHTMPTAASTGPISPVWSMRQRKSVWRAQWRNIDVSR